MIICTFEGVRDESHQFGLCPKNSDNWWWMLVASHDVDVEPPLWRQSIFGFQEPEGKQGWTVFFFQTILVNFQKAMGWPLREAGSSWI